MYVDVNEARNERRDMLDQRWSDFLLTMDIICSPTPNNIEALKRRTTRSSPEGILLVGGNNPAAYGGNAPERDNIDTYLLNLAIKKGIPLFGVCRGMQSLALHFGARLEPIEGHVGILHTLSGKINRNVNSYHTLRVGVLPNCFEVLAQSEDGTIEAIAHREYPFLGIMWHPERCETFQEEDIKLFSNLWNKGSVVL
jgi:putative glutamine amidotransferase